MLSGPMRCGALVLLLLAGGTALRAQGTDTPAARQTKHDRQFLLRRGIGHSPEAREPNAGAGSLERLRAVRARQAAAIARPAAQPPTATTSSWQPAGPSQLSTAAYGLVTGRVSSLAVDPNDSSGNTVYLGATGGGVWKSTRAAGAVSSVQFTPLTDDLAVFANSFTSIPSLSIGAVTVQPGNPQVLLAGTGDPNDALDSYYGVGLLRSGNGGQTWSLIPNSKDAFNGGYSNYSFVGEGFAGFAWSTANTNLVVAAVSQSYEGTLVNTGFSSTPQAGLFYSTDAGQTWFMGTISDGSNEVIQSPNYGYGPPGNPATAVVWNKQRQLFIAAVRYHGYYSSPDGINWSRLANQPGAGLSTAMCPANPGRGPSTSCPIFRGALAVQGITGDTFALTTDGNNVDQGLFQDVCSTSGTQASSCNASTISFGTQINDTALDDPAAPGVIDQADYNLALSALPSQQDTILFAGTEDLYRCSLAAGCVWRNTTNVQTGACAQVAPSVHAIAGAAGANPPVYFGNDGGLWRSTDLVAQTGSVCAPTDATHFQNLNGALGSLAEIEHLAVSPTNSSLVLAGMGEFGIVASESANAETDSGPWQQLLTGEGSLVAIDPNTPANWYADDGGGVNIFSCAQGSSCAGSGFGAAPVIGRSQVEADADYFLDAAPWILDPGNPGAILLGTCRMWLGPVGGSWSGSNLLSSMLDGDGGPYCNGNAELRAVGAGGSYNSAAGGEQMYAGTAGPYDGGGTVPGHIYGATVPQSGGLVSWSDLWRNPVTNRSMSQQFNAGGYAVSSIAVDPHDPTGKTLYVGISGFPSGQSGNLYSSTDGGLHWSNITSSLPLAPLNSIAVDPNTPGTVYVGGDFGVYYTANVANCIATGAQCWSQFSSGLPNAPVTGLQVYSGGSGTVLEAATYGRGIWTLQLTSTAVLAQATLTPASYSFAPQATGTQSSPAPFTLANTGSVSLAIAQVAVSGEYTETNNCGTSLAANSTCTIQVTFAPTATGDQPGTLTVRANVQGGTLTATLDGTGQTPGAIALNPSSLSFPNTATGASSQPMSVTLTNTGQASVQLGSPSLVEAAADFSLGSNACGNTLAGGASCTIAVLFNPTQTGARTGQLDIPTSVQANPFTVSLSGQGVSPAALTFSPSSLAFPETPLGSRSPSASLAVANTGGVAAQLGSASASPSDYIVTGSSCGSTLAPGASCSFSLAFAPTAQGSRAGLFTLASPSIAGGQVTASLNGSGVAAPLSPNPRTFPAQQVQTTSAVQTLTVTNTGLQAAQLGTPGLSNPEFALSANGCPSSLAAGAACTLGLTFTPSGTGTQSGTLTIPYNGAITSATLSGVGTAPGTLGWSPASLSFPTTAENTTAAAQSVTLTNTGGSPTQITSTSVTGPFAVASDSCPVAPQTLPVNGTCTLAITFSPSGTAAYTGAATLSGNFSNSPAAIPLSGHGATPPNFSLTPGSLSFPDTAKGSSSAPQTITVTSTGGVPVTLGAWSVTGQFQVQNDTCPGTLAPGSTCTIAIEFIPSSLGLQTGTFSQPGNVANSPMTVSLSGNGLQPGNISLAPAALQFNSVVTGTHATQTVAVENTGGAPVALGAASVTPSDYAVTGNCPTSLLAGQSCTLSVTFDPVATGDRPGQLTVPWGSSNTATASLDGQGVAPGQLSFNPASLGFGAVATGSTTTLSTTVRNTGGVAVHLSAITLSGSTDFSLGSPGTCAVGTPIPAGGMCTVAVTFSPSANGNRAGTLTLSNDGTPASAQAALAGVGVAPGSVTLSPGSLQFGSVVLHTTTPPQTVTATNPGGLPVNLNPAAVSGSGFTLTANGCGTTLAAGAQCTVQISFTPSVAGNAPGTFTLPGQYSGSPATVSLDANGVTPGALSFNPSPVVNLGPAVLGTTVMQPVTLQNTGGAPVSLGTPSAASPFGVASGCGSTLSPGASCTLEVTFTPASQGAAQGLLSVPSSVGAATDALAGTGLRPGTLTPSPGSLSFAATVVGSSSPSQSATFQNLGDVSVPLLAPAVSSADYTIESSSCGASLAPGTSCTVTLAFTPTTNRDRPGTLTLSGSGSNPPVAHVALDGQGLASARLAFSPPSLVFAGQAANTTSPSQTLTLENGGDVPTSLGMPVLTGAYSIAANSCTGSLGAASSCTIAVQFAPTTSGSLPGSLTVASPSGTPSASASLSGTGLALVLNPTSISFTPAQLIGATSAPILVAIENVGQTAISLQPPSITGDFALGSSACGATLAPNSTCSVNVTFTPTAGGVRTGMMTVTDGNETATVQLTGTGLAPATDTLSAAALTFALTEVGTTSAPQNLTLTNSGDAPLTQISVKTTGPFVAANNCGATLGGHLSCVLAVSFAPTAVGGAGGSLSIADAQRIQTVALSGQGAAPPQAFASPSSLDFGPYALAVTTPPQTVVLSNQGAIPMLGVQTAISGADFSVSSSSCGSALAPGASCQIGVTFTPGTAGNREGTLTVSSSSLTEPLVVSLAGSGEDFALTVAGASSQVITPGQTTQPYTVTITPVGASAGTLNITCSGAPANATCSANPATLSVAAGIASTVNVTVATSTPGATARLRGTSRWLAGATGLALLCPFFLRRRPIRRGLLVLLGALALTIVPLGCGVHASGVGNGSGSTQPGQTPSGSYTLTVSATFPGAVRTAQVTLVVQ